MNDQTFLSRQISDKCDIYVNYSGT